jgi:hypothetical protein
MGFSIRQSDARWPQPSASGLGHHDSGVASGSDVDDPLAGVTIQQLRRHTAARRWRDRSGAGQTLTAAQAAGLLFQPDPDFWGSTSITFTVTDNQGAISAPGWTSRSARSTCRWWVATGSR